MNSYLIRYVSGGEITNRYFSTTTPRKAVSNLIKSGKVSKDDIIAVYQYVPNNNWD